MKAKKGRCSPTEALKLLRLPFEPTDAAVKLTEAMHRDICPVICNGVVIKPDIARRLMVVAKKAHGRWTACIVGNFAMGGVKPKDVWKFEIDKVKTLLPQPDRKAEAVPDLGTQRQYRRDLRQCQNRASDTQARGHRGKRRHFVRCCSLRHGATSNQSSAGRSNRKRDVVS